jgi:hypothetical protein
MHTKLLAAIAALAFIAPTVALAQDAPSYAQPAGQPVAEDGQIQGRISSFDGGYNLIVQDDRGYTDNVQLHDGTIINPTGLTLAPGMVVSILVCGWRSVLRGTSVELLRALDQPRLFLR